MRGTAAAVLVTALLWAPTALAEPHVEFHKPMAGVKTNGQLTVGPDGNIWVALDNAVGRVTPDGTVTIFKQADFDKLGNPEGGITTADGAVWLSQFPSGVQSILKITPGDPPVAVSFPVTDIDAGSTAMALGSDGNIWVGVAGKLVKFPPSDPTNSTVYPFTGLQPKCMAASPDGTLWVSDASGTGQLLNVKTHGTLKHDPYPTGSASVPRGRSDRPGHGGAPGHQPGRPAHDADRLPKRPRRGPPADHGGSQQHPVDHAR